MFAEGGARREKFIKTLSKGPFTPDTGVEASADPIF